MAIRYYLVPLEVTATTRGPKYFAYKGDPDPPALVSATMALQPYGSEPVALVAADVDGAQHALLAAQPDVSVFPLNLANQIGVNLNTVQAVLQSWKIPADMFVGTTTYRSVFRGMLAIFRFAQRFRGKRVGGLFAGRDLDTTLGSLSPAARQNLQDAATELGYDYSGLTGASTLRDVLKKLASQPTPFSLLDVVV